MAQRVDVQYIRYYTEGSAARRLREQYAPVLEQLYENKKAKRKVLRVDPLACAGIVLAVVMLLATVLGFARLSALKEQNVQLQSYVEMQAAENTLLKDAYKESYDLEMVERLANEMGMVPAEEIVAQTVQMDAREPVTLWSQISSFLMGIFA